MAVRSEQLRYVSEGVCQMSVPLSTLLSEGTRETHLALEKSPFMQTLFARRMNLDAYREFLARLYHVYATLERLHASLHEHAVLSWFYEPRLLRTQRLETDLEYYYGRQWRNCTPFRAASRSYVERLLTLAHGWPEGMISHHYVRYLGDLSGGQIIKRLVRQTFMLPVEHGTAFYEFPDLLDIETFKAEYRRKLDALPIDEATARRIVDEANAAFWLNMHLMVDLQPVLGAGW
jgi:heme oxygenase (biliverdin-producing, ferredoxin)